MDKSRFIAIRNQADTSTLELYFLDIIADTYDWYTGFNSKVQEIIDKVNYYKPSKILCIIDSEGGDAQCGMSIYNFLKRCDAKVEVEIIGLAGSIASVIAMSANKGKLRIAKNAFIMIHKAEGGVWGTSDQIRKGADLVDMYTNQIVDIYSQRTGKPVEEINALIENGDYWMAGEDAVAQGFADAIFNEAPNLQIAARLDTSVYKNMPALIRAQLKPAADSPDPEQKSFIQNQLSEMKKFLTDLGTAIMNQIKGVKAPENNDHTALMTSIGTAVSNSFGAAAEQMETAVGSFVNDAIASETVNKAIALQVSNAVAGLDFNAEGPLKTAFDAAVTARVENATKPITAQLTTLETARLALEKKNGELEGEITALKGAKSEDPGAGGAGAGGAQPIGKFS